MRCTLITMIPGLLSGVEKIGNVDLSASKLANAEAVYKTRGNFSIAAYSDGARKIAVVNTGQISGETYRASTTTRSHASVILCSKHKQFSNNQKDSGQSAVQKQQTTLSRRFRRRSVSKKPTRKVSAEPKARPKARAKSKPAKNGKVESKSEV